MLVSDGSLHCAVSPLPLPRPLSPSTSWFQPKPDTWQDKLSAVVSKKNGVLFLRGGDASASALSRTAFPSDPAPTAFCLLLWLLPSFCHVLLGPMNKSGPALLFLTNRKGAERQRGGRWFLANGGGGRGGEPSSWAVGTGTQPPAGPAAGVPDGQPWLCLSPPPAFVYIPASSLSPSNPR